MINQGILCRLARSEDIPAIRRMQEHSIRVLGTGFYRPDDIEAFLRTFSTMDDRVVAEGHYFVLVTADGRIVASAGWSQQPPGYSGGRETFEPSSATVRSVFVDAEFGRRGLGRKVMEMVEADAAAAGITDLAVAATLSGVPLYEALGYRETRQEVIEIGLQRFPLVRMRKTLSAASNGNEAIGVGAELVLRATMNA